MTGSLPHNSLASAAGRRQVKAARRLVLAQCDLCSASGSAQLSGFGRVTLNLPARRVQSVWVHNDCGGRIEMFDIEVGR